ncbi:cysteine proteinase inhibitor B [Mangifera indica]|uniref:cysteine proteinase inhibitor B n=1 Tax=Mangifera indica TaxID=29780 RepID=UPI001CF9B025|nr:cysteine proteinase inhibitor B [Mangifera indica]
MAKPRTLIFVVVLLFIIASVKAYEGFVGGKTEVKNVKSNKEVQDLGRFSVEEFNRQGINGFGDLVFSEVIEAQKQVVSGFKYYLKIEATTRKGDTKVFDSVVVIKPWLHSKELLNFAPSK